MEGRTYRDGIELKPADIFRHVSAGGEICSTTAINTAEYCGAFTELRKECGALIHFTIGSALSSCYQNAVLAAEEVPGVTVVDSTGGGGGGSQGADPEPGNLFGDTGGGGRMYGVQPLRPKHAGNYICCKIIK